MQPGYGILSNIHPQRQQVHLMEDDCCCSPPVLPISNLQNLNHPYQPHLQQQQEQLKHPHHVFLQQHHHLFQQHQQERLHRQIQQQQGQAPSQNPSFFAVNFKLGLNGDSRDEKVGAFSNHIDAAAAPSATFLDGNGHNNPPHAILMPHSWYPHEDSTTIKDPFWKQLDKQHSGNEGQKINGNSTKYFRPLQIQQLVDESSDKCKNLENKFPLFNELEAIYNLAKIAETNQTGSGSALTGENSPTNADLSMPFKAANGQKVGPVGAADNEIGVDHGSENSIGEEASLRKSQKRKRKRKLKEKLSFMAGFFENTVKQVMYHQEILHTKFLEAIERMDKKRTEREETWRRHEAQKYEREAIFRAHEQALASSREAQIVSYIEKITGKKIDLPARMTPSLLQPEISNELIKETTPMKTESQSRWPKHEVDALIQVRSRIEIKFQEPGLKGPLWEEVSSLMSSMGYRRSAKRCKEKWENINKYFRKAKESSKRRSRQSKTCSYFSQLDQLYSRTPISYPSQNTYIPASGIEFGIEKQGYSELLDAFVIGGDQATISNPLSENAKSDEMGTSRFEFDGITDGKAESEPGSREQDKEFSQTDKQNGGEQQKDDGGGSEEIENRG